MKIEIKVPAAGESVTEADIAVWHKSNGDQVELDEPILELETDKASLELTAEQAGVLTINVEEGQTVQVGQVIGVIDTDGASKTSATDAENEITQNAEPKAQSGELEKIEITVPAAGESVNEADIAAWSKDDGDMVELDDVLLELETDKASLELAAEASGKLTILAKEGETVQVGQVIGFIMAGQSSSSKSEPAAEPQAASKTSEKENYATGHPSPAAAILMAEKNVSLSSGSGKDGRITKEDVMNAKPNVSSEKVEKPVEKPHQQSKESNNIAKPSSERGTRREKMSRLRRTISTRLVEAQQTAALLTTFNEIDMSGVMAMRKKYKDAFKEKYEVGLGFMSFFSKAAAIALQNLTFQDVERTIMDFAIRGRAGNITPDDMTGGTFTITNGGTFGSMLSTPIVNRPQSAILGMHNIVQRPIAVDGQVEIRPVMYVAVTYDHRIIDGSDAVQFLVRIKELIEDPSRIMLSI